MMRIFVTGREGQVARSLAERARGHRLIFGARPALDLLEFQSIRHTLHAVRPDLVISAAAYTAVDRAEVEPDLAMHINGEAPGVLAQVAAEIGSPIIHLSTDYVFDGRLNRPWRESDATAPLGVYGASKLAGEEAVRASGATFAIIRTAWVYSPFGANFVRTMLRLAASTDEVSVVDDQIGNPTSAHDLADALLTVADVWRQDPGLGANAVYHFAGGGETDWAGFARAIFDESARLGGPTANVRGIPSSDYPTRAKRPANSRLDCTRFAEAFNHRAPHWRDGLAPVVERLVNAM